MLSYFHIHFVSDKQEREREYGLNHRKNMLRANFIHAVNLKYETTFWLFVNANVELKKAICSMHHRLDLKMKEYTQILWNGFDDKKETLDILPEITCTDTRHCFGFQIIDLLQE